MTGVAYDAPRPDHTCTLHQPGSRACHNNHGCRCRECTDETNRWHLKYKTGQTNRVPASLVRTHLERLIAAGQTPAGISIAAAVASSTVSRILGGQRFVNRLQALALLAVTPDPPNAGHVNATGTARRLQALSAIGWDSAEVARRLHVRPERVQEMRSMASPTLYVATAQRVEQVYDQLSMTPNTGWRAHRSRTIAAQRGWMPPLAWDEGRGTNGIDNPKAKPHRARPVPTPRRTTDAEVLHLIGTDSADGIARRLGFANLDSLATTIGRHDKQLADKLRAAKEVA